MKYRTYRLVNKPDMEKYKAALQDKYNAYRVAHPSEPWIICCPVLVDGKHVVPLAIDDYPVIADSFDEILLTLEKTVEQAVSEQ
jgi:hypothetical protein